VIHLYLENLKDKGVIETLINKYAQTEIINHKDQDGDKPG
jgi:hypothetical protein